MRWNFHEHIYFLIFTWPTKHFLLLLSQWKIWNTCAETETKLFPISLSLTVKFWMGTLGENPKIHSSSFKKWLLCEWRDFPRVHLMNKLTNGLFFSVLANSSHFLHSVSLPFDLSSSSSHFILTFFFIILFFQ